MKKFIINLAIILTLPLTGMQYAFASDLIMLNNIGIHTDAGDEVLELNGDPGTVFQQNLEIENYSDKSVTLNLKINEARLEGTEFELSEPGTSPDMTDWINLRWNNVTIPAGKKTVVPIQITYPKNAGVGKHAAAIMASQLNASEYGAITTETGIRIIASVAGSPSPKYKLINPRITEKEAVYTYNGTLVNTGNTDLRGTANLINQTALQDTPSSASFFLRPGEEYIINLHINKPALGGQERLVSELQIGNEKKVYLLKEGFSVPFQIPLTALTILTFILILGIMAKLWKQKEIPANTLRNGTFITVTIFALALYYYGSPLLNVLLRANTFTGDGTSYLTTIKWGNFGDKKLPDWLITNWDGHLTLDQGEMFMVEKLHNEDNDHINIDSSGQTLTFNNNTGPDNDGVIVLIKTAEGNHNPVISLYNRTTGETVMIPLNTTVDSPRLVSYKQNQIQIKTESAPSMINLATINGYKSLPLSEFGKTILSSQFITEINASPELSNLISDLESTPENRDMESDTVALQEQEASENAQRLYNELNLLKGLIDEIPSSPDVISEYILSSSHIETINSENYSTLVKSSTSLINALKEAPLTIAELTSSPDLNYVFIPSEKIKLTDQTFSFSETRRSSQTLNEIVFIQRKTMPWNIYFSISDLNSVGGNGTIPASNIILYPGTVKIINQSGEPAEIEVGDNWHILNSLNQAKLLTIKPKANSQTTFSMSPSISVTIPPKTLPGLYKGEITIKAI